MEHENFVREPPYRIRFLETLEKHIKSGIWPVLDYVDLTIPLLLELGDFQISFLYLPTSVEIFFI